jgi:hypothetical protein
VLIFKHQLIPRGSLKSRKYEMKLLLMTLSLVIS